MANYYYRQVQFGPGGISPVIRNLVIANVAVFLIQSLLLLIGGASSTSPYVWFSYHFGISPDYFLAKFNLWQPVSYMFLHANLLHILFNMFFLWMFGTEVEQRMGSRAFLIFYFFCGIGAGLLSVLFNSVLYEAGILLNTPNIRLWTTPTMGASGAIFGVLLAFGLMFPNRIILLFFIFPVPAFYFVLGLCFIELYFLVFMSHGTNVSYIAHAGGMLFGFLFFRYFRQIMNTVDSTVDRGREAREKLEQYNEKEAQERVDAILDKINREGIHRLTRAERKFLRDHIRRHRH